MLTIMEITSSIADVNSADLQQSPLLSAHLRLGGRMVPFAGWNMPVQYSGITQEHTAVRTGCGIFDISHMGEFFVSGAAAGAWLNRQLTNNTEKLKPGEGQYTLMLDEFGGVIDDLIVYRLAEDRWFLVVNASKVEEDRKWLISHLNAVGVEFMDQSAAWAGMAIQGPKAASVFTAMTGGTLPARNGVMELDTPDGRIIVCRTGYTGEDGFELFCHADDGVAWWDRAIAAGATPCGLGARDTLRLEMCYPLNGNDLSPDHSPLEAGLGFFVDMEKGDFTGRDLLASQKEHGMTHKLAAIRLADKSPPARAHYPVLSGGQPVGELCSGGISPSMGCSIGMAYLPPELAAPGTKLEIDIRGRTWPAEVVKKPFYRKPVSA
ncbi:MAG TPA: glycine cleavage system aminomethyltransferase GcvT [Verrucomicrobiales bacterium]|nr:glycine cleavage system aminomethyltransferase GcvT [Verrucomicrobiales bacterium]